LKEHANCEPTVARREAARERERETRTHHHAAQLATAHDADHLP
jgi:hypothetical protein